MVGKTLTCSTRKPDFALTFSTADSILIQAMTESVWQCRRLRSLPARGLQNASMQPLMASRLPESGPGSSCCRQYSGEIFAPSVPFLQHIPLSPLIPFKLELHVLSLGPYPVSLYVPNPLPLPPGAGLEVSSSPPPLIPPPAPFPKFSRLSAPPAGSPRPVTELLSQWL